MSFLTTVGTARRSQGIFTYGVGAIADFKKGSFMPLGLWQMDQQWYGLPNEARDGLRFYEPRLQRLLGVKSFRGYPAPGEGRLSEYGERVKGAWGVPCVRFPEWLECPRCHRLGTIDDPFDLQPSGYVNCLNCGGDTRVNPVRFVVACDKGHIDDFPWIEWAHQSRSGPCDRPIIRLNSKGRSAALADLYITCMNCSTPPAGLGQIFRLGAMKRFRCRGRRPWIGISERCGGDLRTLQRGGSNVHFPVVASMLSIPPASEAISKILEPEWYWLSVAPDVGLEAMIEGVFRNRGITVDVAAAVDWVRRRKGIDENEETANELAARYEEFEALQEEVRPIAVDTHRPEFENSPFAPPDNVLPWIDLVSTVHRLREVRALCGFTRISPFSLNIEEIPEAIVQKTISPLATGNHDWRPAVEVRGEGIFFRLNEVTVSQWEGAPELVERSSQINAFLLSRCERDGTEPPYQITPRHLLVHSFAHILVRRMSLDCGYSSASLRERLYISEGGKDVPPMAAFLIYTASPDSDGSLGGLVSLATPERIGGLIARAVRDAVWCGNDPVCIEADPRLSGERMSAAACHNCVLLPETACEKFNRELDRGMLVGLHGAQMGGLGFFKDFPFEGSL